MALELKKVENTADILDQIERTSNGMRISNIDDILSQFMLMEQPVMEVEWMSTYKSVQSALATFNNRIKKQHYHAKAVKVKDRLYLLNLEMR